MYIFIMRHGEAVNNAGEDSLRSLTKNGTLETTIMGQWLAQQNVSLEHIFVSPYLRAQQSCKNVITAIYDASSMNTISPETIDMITPSGNAYQVHNYLDGILHDINCFEKESKSSQRQAILLVSHMPFISYLVGELTGSVNMPVFSTGAIAVIDYNVESMQGRFEQMISPENVNT